MDKETLHFKIGLKGSSPLKQPEISIVLGNNELFSGSLNSPPNQVEYFEFDAEIVEGENTLIIELKNKFSTDTVVGPDNNIVSDMLLTIESIEIDEIDIGSLLWVNSTYYPKYPQDYIDAQNKLGNSLESELKEFVDLGWNGKWLFPFQSPFYIWLLENI